MAKRRQLEVPTPEALAEIEEGFRSETSRPATRAPIADIVADAAGLTDPLPQHQREENARDKADAAELRAARDKGLIAVELPIDQVLIDGMSRDRIKIDEEELEELTTSIAQNGLRLPIEVFENVNPDAGGDYGLISGHRRLAAFQRLNALHRGANYTTIPAFVRAPDSLAAAFAAMIEENEVRSGLSQYERGRAAAMAVHQEIFATIDEAVAALFTSASKAKRSKIRSFATIHDDLGDLLDFGTEMSERQCLALAGALRSGFAADLRDALAETEITSAADEWNAMSAIIDAANAKSADPAKGGRPKAPKRTKTSAHTKLANGISMHKEKGPNGYAIRLQGKAVNDDLVDAMMQQIQHLLESH